MNNQQLSELVMRRSDLHKQVCVMMSLLGSNSPDLLMDSCLQNTRILGGLKLVGRAKECRECRLYKSHLIQNSTFQCFLTIEEFTDRLETQDLL